MDGAMAAFENSDSTITVGGTANSNNGDVSGNHSANNGDIWVVETDLSGNLLWQRCYGGSELDLGLVAKLSGKDYLVFGSAYSNDGDVSFNHSTQLDYWLAKIDSSGAILWDKSYGGTAGESSVAAIPTWDSGAAVAGGIGFICC